MCSSFTLKRSAHTYAGARCPRTVVWHRTHPPKMDTPRAATTKTPSQTHCWLIHSPNTCPFSLPWLCDPRDAHLSPSSRRKSCLVGAKEVGPSRWSGADSGISLWPNSDEWNMRGSGLGRLLRKVFCAWRSKCFGGVGGGEEAFYLPTGKAYKERRKLDSWWHCWPPAVLHQTVPFFWNFCCVRRCTPLWFKPELVFSL